ncbi:hypothetical protein ABW19_dt0207297 [Dactylella cylindrospora]|nr:hypothetical protein ABW19_dt0207297 [Dactylella cylindrospora]
MWDNVLPENRPEMIEREKELKTNDEYWGVMYESGSPVMRLENSERSALAVISQIMQIHDKSGKFTLRVVEEMLGENRNLGETGAGRIAVEGLGELKEHYEKRLRDLEETYRIAQEESNKKLQDRTTDLQTQSQKMRDEIDKLEERLSQKSDELIDKQMEFQATLREQMQQGEVRVRRLEKKLEEDQNRTKKIQAEANRESENTERTVRFVRNIGNAIAFVSPVLPLSQSFRFGIGAYGLAVSHLADNVVESEFLAGLRARRDMPAAPVDDGIDI